VMILLDRVGKTNLLTSKAIIFQSQLSTHFHGSLVQTCVIEFFFLKIFIFLTNLKSGSLGNLCKKCNLVL